jgi:hypothetical protein
MKQSRVSGLLCAGVLVVFSAVVQAEDANGKEAGVSVSQDALVHSPSASDNLYPRIHHRKRINGVVNLGFLIGCGIIGYVMLRKANTS